MFGTKIAEFEMFFREDPRNRSALASLAIPLTFEGAMAANATKTYENKKEDEKGGDDWADEGSEAGDDDHLDDGIGDAGLVEIDDVDDAGEGDDCAAEAEHEDRESPEAQHPGDSADAAL